MSVKQVAPKDLKAQMDRGDDFFLLDVREPFERDIATIGGTLIPLKDLKAKMEDIPMDKPIVVYCRSGGRSQKAADDLVRQGYDDVSNLSGGILKWRQDVDPSIKEY